MGVSGSFSYPAFEALRDANETLAGMFAATPTFLNLVVDGQAEIASGLAATGDYFRVLGVQPAAGRVIGPDDDRPGAEPVAMISHSFRERRFGPEASPTGTVIRVNDVPTTIVGVLPPGYAGISRPAGAAADVHLSLATLPLPEGDDRLADATFWWLPIMGRLKPGATPAQVRGNLDGVLQAAAQSVLASLLDGLTEEERGRARYRNRSAEPRLLVDSGRQGLYDANRRSSGQALILGVAVTLVLLIVCANVVTLLLSREVSRQRGGDPHVGRRHARAADSPTGDREPVPLRRRRDARPARGLGGAPPGQPAGRRRRVQPRAGAAVPDGLDPERLRPRGLGRAVRPHR